MTEPRDPRTNDPDLNPPAGRPGATGGDPVAPTGSPRVMRGSLAGSNWIWALAAAIVLALLLWWILASFGGEPDAVVAPTDEPAAAVE